MMSCKRCGRATGERLCVSCDNAQRSADRVRARKPKQTAKESRASNGKRLACYLETVHKQGEFEHNLTDALANLMHAGTSADTLRDCLRVAEMHYGTESVAAGIAEQRARAKEKTLRVVCASGLNGERSRLRDRYDSRAQFLDYSNVYGLAHRLGYDSADEAWKDNPMVESSVDPRDFRKVSE